MPPSALSVVLWATDLDAFAAFLEGVLGAAIRERHPGFAALTIDGAEILLHADESYRGHPWFDALGEEGAARGIGAEIRLRVGAVRERYRRALELGAVSIQAPHEDGGARTCQLMGPDGYFFTLWEPSPAEPSD